MFVYGVRHCKLPGGDDAPRNGTQRLQDRRTNWRQSGNSPELETRRASAADGRTSRTCRHMVSPGRPLVLLSTRGVSRGRHDPCAEGHVVVHRERPSVCGRFERDPRAMATTFSGRSPRVHPSSSGESDILCISHPAIVRAFPQHGPGRKHLRSIVLADWQLELTHAHPGSLVRGLIDSDGCRVVTVAMKTSP